MNLTRRQTLTGFSAAAVFLTAGQAFAGKGIGNVMARLTEPEFCASTATVAEGPFYIAGNIGRQDIREDRRGAPLCFHLRVVDADTCSPLPGFRMDIWHADASGCFSGFQAQGDERTLSTVGETFLRGTQHTDANGRVTFTTIYPGWYSGRTPHIHLKAFFNHKKAFARQVYFPDELSDTVYSQITPYSHRGRRRDTTNNQDPILRSSRGGRRNICSVERNDGHYLAAATISLSP